MPIDPLKQSLVLIRLADCADQENASNNSFESALALLNAAGCIGDDDYQELLRGIDEQRQMHADSLDMLTAFVGSLGVTCD